MVAALDDDAAANPVRYHDFFRRYLSLTFLARRLFYDQAPAQALGDDMFFTQFSIVLFPIARTSAVNASPVRPPPRGRIPVLDFKHTGHGRANP
jgi:hypothetical protein